jgi:hypothetical protein
MSLTLADLAQIQAMISAAPTVGEGFPQPIVAGNVLLIPAIQSPDFSIEDQTGWAIMKNGQYWLFGGTTTGTLTIAGPGDGVFVYQGTAGLGTLIVAISSAAGVDQFGNSYSCPGISITGPGGANEIQIRPDLNGIFIYE